MRQAPVGLIRRLLVSLLPVVVAVPAQAQPGLAEFVRVQGSGFVIGDEGYHFVGVNFWYGMNLGADGPSDARLRPTTGIAL